MLSQLQVFIDHDFEDDVHVLQFPFGPLLESLERTRVVSGRCFHKPVPRCRAPMVHARTTEQSRSAEDGVGENGHHGASGASDGNAAHVDFVLERS